MKQQGFTIHKQQQHLLRWAEHYKAQFGWALASASPTANPESESWTITTNTTFEAQILREIQASGYHKAMDSSGIFPGNKRNLLRSKCFIS